MSPTCSGWVRCASARSRSRCTSWISTLEREAVARLNQAIALCLDRKDAGTRELLEHLLVDEEESVDWLETQLNVVNDIGRERYLAEQLRSS